MCTQQRWRRGGGGMDKSLLPGSLWVVLIRLKDAEGVFSAPRGTRGVFQRPSLLLEGRQAPGEIRRCKMGEEAPDYCPPHRDPQGRGLDPAEPPALPPGHDFVGGYLPQEQPAAPQADRHQPLTGL